jgi:hypothetical protein
MARMAGVHPTIAIDPGGRLLRAVELRTGRGGVHVLRAIAKPYPPGLDPSDPQALGRFVASTLDAAGFGAGDIVATLDRDRATVRRLDLPSNEDTELPDMARLVMQRETPAEAGPLVVDLLPLERSATQTTVLVVAAPERSVAELRAVVEAAGRRLARISLRTMGMARLLADRPSASGEGVTVGIDATGESAELVTLRRGDVVSSRVGGRTSGDEHNREQLVAEVKRMAMAQRLAEVDAPIAEAVLLAATDDREALAALERVFGVRPIAYEPPSSIGIAEGVDRAALDASWPLVGLLLELCAEEESIDLAAPRRAPDRSALRRQRILLAVGAFAIAGLLGWTLGNQSRRAFEESVSELRTKANSALPEHLRFKRDSLRRAHLDTWVSARTPWLEHLRFLHGFAPDPAAVLIDTWSGTLETSDVRYDRDRRWSVATEVKIAFEGEARDRGVADALRDALVDDARYALTSTGADAPGGRRLGSPFSYVLRTRDPRSPADRAPPTPSSASGRAPEREADS